MAILLRKPLAGFVSWLTKQHYETLHAQLPHKCWTFVSLLMSNFSRKSPLVPGHFHLPFNVSTASRLPCLNHQNTEVKSSSTTTAEWVCSRAQRQSGAVHVLSPAYPPALSLPYNSCLLKIKLHSVA